MKGYRQFLKELPSKKVVFAFGRFNPPTTGHELLVKAVKKLAADSDHVIYASRSQDSKKNPLPVDRKVYYLQRMFPGTKFVAADESVRTFIEAAKELNKKYKDLVMVAGSDRVQEYKKLLDKYNGKEFKFSSIQVISAGERDPDSDEASGMSATKMREAAKKGDFMTFKRGLPHTLTTVDARRLMNEVREGMGLEAIKESIKFTVDQIREKYFHGEIFHVGEIVESNGQQYEIVKRGSNHLLLKEESGKLVSKFPQDVNLVEDIKGGDIPDEITFHGYTTKNLHHSEDARRAFIDTIERVGSQNPAVVLNALRATDTYMKLNDMHLEQGKAPDEAEIKTWIAAHDHAKQYLESLGEFMHHEDYWRNHQRELELMLSDYKEAGKEEMSEEFKELHEMEKQLVFTAADKIKVARIIATTLGVDNAQSSTNAVQLVNQGLRNIRRKPLTKNGYEIVMNMLKTARLAGIDYDEKLIPTQAQAVEEETLDEVSSDLVKKARDAAFSKGKDDQGHRFVRKAYEKGKKESDAMAKKMAEAVKEPTGNLKDACWKGYTAVGMKMKNGKKVPNCVPQEGVIQPDGTDKVGQYEESDYNVKVTHRTASGETAHKIYKVVKAKDHRHAQNIALNKHTAALDKAGTKFVAATSSVMKEEVQIDETVESPVVNTSSDYNIAQSIMRYSDMMKMIGKKPIEKAAGAYQDEGFENFPEQKKDTESDMDAEVGDTAEPQTHAGHLMTPPYEADASVRRRKIKYHLGEGKEVQFLAKPEVEDDEDELGDEEDKGYDAFFEEEDLNDEEIQKMVDDLSDDEIIDVAYEDDEFAIVDDETGEEYETDEMNEEAINEVLSRMERIRAKQRLARTKAKRQRAEKIALRKFSTTKVVNNRARRLAVKAMKKRFTRGRDMKKLSVAEKERLEARIKKLQPIINRIALKMVPRVRQLEKARLSHRNFTK